MVPLPVLFIDERMPDLKDSELRVILAVARQTCVAGRETRSAWLTHAELCRRTGRASEAISGAIDALVKKGLLEVVDEDGSPLLTPATRRRAQGRRYYRVRLIGGGHDDNGNPKTIEGTESNYRFRKTDLNTDNPKYIDSRSEASEEVTADQQIIDAEKDRIRERLRLLL